MTSISHVTAADIYAALASSELGVAHADLDGRLKDVNPSLCKLLGYSREELAGRHFSDITHPDDIEKNIQGVAGVISGAVPSYRVEKRYIRKDNKVIWAALLLLLIKKDGDIPDSLLVLIEDITDRKTLEREKQTFELHYKSLFNQLPDSIVLVNDDTEIVGFNDEALHTYEYSPQEMLRLKISDFSLTHNEEQLKEIRQQLILTGQQDFVSKHRTKNGRVLDVKVSIRKIDLPDKGRIYQCVARDVTSFRQVGDA